MLLKKIDFDGNGISAEEMEVYFHPHSNQIEIAFFKDNHYVDGIWLPAPDISAPVAEQEDATVLEAVACACWFKSSQEYQYLVDGQGLGV